MIATKANIVVRLRFSSKRLQEITYGALKPETDKPPRTTRSKTVMEKTDDFLVLTIEARDVVALRATVNAYLRWTSSIYGVCSALDSLTLSKEQ
jgi:tRNA threonylcarbamoyladenosine modification (KEOPS) complex  Pcc1 subunit